MFSSTAARCHHDIQRFLRDVNSSFNIQTLDAQAIKVDSYELGWRGDWDQWQADVTVYETPDVTQFYDANERVLRLIDQKERVRGIENSLTYRATDRWSRGTYAGAKARPAERQMDRPRQPRIYQQNHPGRPVAPRTSRHYACKAQLASHDAALKDDNGRDINGYTLVDLLGSVELLVGRLEGGVFNLTDRNYQNLFAQSNAKAPMPTPKAVRSA